MDCTIHWIIRWASIIGQESNVLWYYTWELFECQHNYCLFAIDQYIPFFHLILASQQELGLTCPEDLFDIETFRDDPRPFFKFAHSLYPGSINPSPSHKFLASLDRQQKLLRIYTQNIDSLEQLAGVRSEKIVYAHGSLSNATCMKCRATYSASDIASDVKMGRVPLCHHPRNKKARTTSSSGCSTLNNEQSTKSKPTQQQHSMSLRRSSTKQKYENDSDLTVMQGLCGGVIKPNVTFFGEKLDNIVGRSLEMDYGKADALLVMGTSLSV